jgi:DNA-binding IclR family transcriptional regulator
MASRSAEPDSGRYTVRSVGRALDLLAVYTRGQGEYTLTELARETGLGKPTVHRLVRTLEEHRFVERRPDGRYALGPTVAALGMIALETRDLSRLVDPLLQQVVADTGETASCTVLEGDQMVTIASVAGRHRLQYAVYPGERVPASVTADGRVMLAELPPDELPRRVAAGAPLLAALEQVREEGVCFDLEGEFEPGIACVAVPLRNHRGDVIAALALTIPSLRLTDRLMTKATKALRAAAAEAIPWSAEADARVIRSRSA